MPASPVAANLAPKRLAPTRTSRPSAALLTVLAAFALGGCAIGPERELVLLHAAFGTAREVVVEGRVVESRADEGAEADVADDSRTNLLRNAALFTADECDECPVTLALDGLAPERTETDEEGYFRTRIEPEGAGMAGGWQPLLVTSGSGERRGEALVVPPGNRLGIVSDIDDTVLVTEVGDRFRMIGNTFFRNPLQREAVPGMADLYARTLATDPVPDAAPLFYLSSSPRELQDYLGGFLERNDFPKGVLITRRLTFDAIGYEQLDAVTYKTARLVDILERLPDVRFVLVGDDGEHDPDVYAEIRRRYPERIVAVWIRRADPSSTLPLPEGQTELADVLDGTVPLPVAPDAVAPDTVASSP